MKAPTARKLAEKKIGQSEPLPIDRPVSLGKAEMKWGSDVVAEVTRRLDLKYIALVPGASYLFALGLMTGTALLAVRSFGVFAGHRLLQTSVMLLVSVPAVLVFTSTAESVFVAMPLVAA